MTLKRDTINQKSIGMSIHLKFLTKRNRGDAKEIHPRSITISEDKPPIIVPTKQLPKLPTREGTIKISKLTCQTLKN